MGNHLMPEGMDLLFDCKLVEASCELSNWKVQGSIFIKGLDIRRSMESQQLATFPWYKT